MSNLHMRSLSRLAFDTLLHFKPNSIHHIKQLHAHLITNAVSSPPLLAKLIHHYCAFSSPHYAYTFFIHLRSPNLFLFNTLIKCLPPSSSILVFADWVSREALVFDDFTYIFALGACARSPSLWEGRQIHARILKQGVWSNVLVQTTAIHFYANNNDVALARLVFDEMRKRSSVTWNAMITGYCSQRGKVVCYARDALVLFRAMLVDACGVKPTDTTMVCVLSAASQLGVLETGVGVHGYIEKTVLAPANDVFVGTGLVDIHGRGKEALELLDEMVAYGVKPNAVTFTSLFSACCHAGLVEEGLQLFHSMRSKFGVTPGIQHYGCIVDLLGRAGHLKEAYDFVRGMPVEPDAILWRSLLSACKVHRDVVMGEEVGKLLLQLQPQQSFADLVAASEDFIALSNVYASAERWEDVETVREAMKVKGIETKPGCSSVQTSG
uniref:Pentatricopeptide repeat-containing protein n=1 Tax=Vitis vinifera TaxID=29760 RepID=A5BP14_VITVI|nr:hypothetical protein VITISV_022137 [Vitis vinifera]